MPEPIVNLAAVEPLFAPHEEPNQHRARAQGDQPAQAKKGRRPSKIGIAQSLRSHVKQWRETDYPGASDTTRELLHHWFGRDHLMEAGGLQIPFRYYFCQREAIETLIYLYEVRGIRSLTPLMSEFAGPSAETAALGVNPDNDRWAKYAFKLATGADKTKVMSLAIVWSYFHALRESDSPMAKHFVVTAPNLTVFERLKTDFKPAEGGADIFDKDPLIPVAWKGDWNMSVVLQDEASGAATGGTLYLTNIHRLYDKERRKKEAETYDWMGPTVSRAKALDTGAELRKRITGHERVMILNDEAHHLWDPGPAANEAISYLHETIAARTGSGLVSQLDFSATPKDNNGQMFQHVVCDTPLGEAVDAGIVKTPICAVDSETNDHQGGTQGSQCREIRFAVETVSSHTFGASSGCSGEKDAVQSRAMQPRFGSGDEPVPRPRAGHGGVLQERRAAVVAGGLFERQRTACLLHAGFSRATGRWQLCACRNKRPRGQRRPAEGARGGGMVQGGVEGKSKMVLSLRSAADLRGVWRQPFGRACADV
jgi:hypothetical protein